MNLAHAVRGALLLAVLALTGCPDRHPQPADYSDDPARLIAAVQRQSEAVRSLSGQLAIEVWHDGDRVRLKQFIAADRQGRLRIDALSPFGQPLSTLVSDGSRLMIYSLEDKKFYVGAATPENLARLMPVELEPETLAALLRGSVPIMAHDRATVSWNGSAGAYRLDLEAGEQGQQIEFAPDTLRVTRLRRRVGGKLRYDARFAEWTGKGDAAIPRRIRSESPADDLRVDLEVVDHQIDPDLPDEAFHLEPQEA